VSARARAVVTIAFASAAITAATVVAARRRSPGSAPGSHGAAPVEIAPGVFCLGPWGRTQTDVYLVRAGSSWFLVDAGWASDAARIEAATRGLLGPGIAPSAILLTHVHPDHAGSARALAARWACPILLHPAEMPIADGDFAAMERSAGPLDRWVILPAMRAMGERRRATVIARGSLGGRARGLATDGSIPGIDGWTWIHTPGHTPGHVSFVRSVDRVVLTGDALVTLDVNAPAGLLFGRQGLSGPPWYTTWDRGAAEASVATIAELDPVVVGGGHGRPLAGAGTQAAVRAFAERTWTAARSVDAPLTPRLRPPGPAR
jgi:glyoxylase-like metal-dependent hydrolase (beta-lactamase superfamily II)